MLKRLKRKLIRKYKKQIIGTLIAAAAMSGITPQASTAAAAGGNGCHVIKEIKEGKWKKEWEKLEQKTVIFENFSLLIEE